MKLMIDERLKHKLVGIAVIVAVGTIFAPVLIKKSSQRFDNTNISIKLPPKPRLPKLAMPEKSRTFQNMRIAHIEIPDIPVEAKSIIEKTPKAESISTLHELKATMVAATKDTVKFNDQLIIAQKPKALVSNVPPPKNQAVTLALTKKTAVSNNLASSSSTLSSKRPIPKAALVTKASKYNQHNNYYAVQVGIFSQRENAVALINTLKTKGYVASYGKIKSKNGTAYRVIVGQLNQKQQAIFLQQRLASATQIKGFVITTGIS